MGGTKLFDLLLVNLGGAPEPIPFLDVIPPGDFYFGLLVMTLYLVGFSALLYTLEKHTLNTKYILTFLPLLIVSIAWILLVAGFPVDIFMEEAFGIFPLSETWWGIFFFLVPRTFIPFAYLYLIFKTSGIYRKKSLSLFWGYGIISVFFIRFPQYEFLAPYLIISGLIFIIWGHKEA